MDVPQASSMCTLLSKRRVHSNLKKDKLVLDGVRAKPVAAGKDHDPPDLSLVPSGQPAQCQIRRLQLAVPQQPPPHWDHFRPAEPSQHPLQSFHGWPCLPTQGSQV